MPVTFTSNIKNYTPLLPIPKFEGSKDLHLERELRNIQKSIRALKEAVEEIQEYLESSS